MRHSDILTTGEIARGMNVSGKLVREWIDGGKLKGWRIPYSEDRRANLEDVEAFAEKHSVPFRRPIRKATRIQNDTECGELMRTFRERCEELKLDHHIELMELLCEWLEKH